MINISTMPKLIIHPSEFSPFESKMIEFNDLLNPYSKTSLKYLCDCKQHIYFNRNQYSDNNQRINY